MPATTLIYTYKYDEVMKGRIAIYLKEEWEHPESLLGLLESLQIKGYISYVMDPDPQ